MKVRPSVKPMCEKCKIIKRKGKSWSSARTPSTSSARVNALTAGERAAQPAPHEKY